MAKRPRRKETLSTRVFRTLLALYPAAFRDEYGRELALVFVDRYRDAVAPWDRARLWLEAVVGILVEAPREVGMRLIAGRALMESDRADTAKVAVVNKTLATSYFGDWQQVIGHRFGLAIPDIEIVGIVDDVRGLGNLKAAAMPSVFVPLAQRAVAPRALEVRTSVDPALAIAGVRRAIGSAAPELPIEHIEAVTARVRRGLSQERLIVLLTSGFSVLAIGLAGFGLFGVLSYAVVRRTPELGLRMALGAQRSRVLWGVVRDALWLVMCGLLLGLPLVVLGSSLVSTLIFGVTPYDGVSVLVAVMVLLGIGGACGIVPALRAARVDPVVALRYE